MKSLPVLLNSVLTRPVYLSSLHHPDRRKVPGGQGAQVFVGTFLLFGLAAAPVVLKDEKKGHDYFSQAKPQVVEEAEEARAKVVARLNK
jgi:hypothetical protein